MKKVQGLSPAAQNSAISKHSYEELAVLHTIAQIFVQPRDLREQLEQVLRIISERLGLQRGMISLIDQDKKEAWLDIAYGIDIKGLDVTYKPGEGITGKVVETGRPIAVANLEQATHFLDRTGARRNLNRSRLAFLCTPIVYNDRIVGVLSADKVAEAVANPDRDLAILSSIAELMAKAVHIRAIEEENQRLKKIVSRGGGSPINIIGRSKAMQDVFNLVTQVADSNTTVLITGQTGTGKELITRAIHASSSRRSGPLIQVNCAAIPDTLMESELFGHERGAFTGALHPRRGRFEEAFGGTLFLDEVGELSPTAQVKMLRVLQEKQFQPLGSSRTVKVNARIIAATNRNLEEDVREERFRADLYYRLNVFPICLPALRERGSDIFSLADYFIMKYSRETGKPVKNMSTAVMDVFLTHQWPGNVRELENCIERAVLLCDSETIECMHLPPSLRSREKEPERKETHSLPSVIEARERALIIDALGKTGGNQTKAAKILGITKRIIQYKITKMKIDTQIFRRKNHKLP